MLARGPVVLGIGGLTLDGVDRERLLHPLVGGVILFSRNYENVEQLAALTAQIHALRTPALLISVDHEGGRVQRFRDGFTAIPPMRTLGDMWQRDAAAAGLEARRVGGVIARELRAQGVDFSFTPVLDVDFGTSAVIGDRAFSDDPDVVAELAVALCRGLREGGCAAVGKHFPGHGGVAADSHVALPIDARPLADIVAADIVPFARLISRGALDGVMPAHIVYPAVAPEPAGFSPRWLQEILRAEMGFDGVVFSDDLEMAGAHGAGDVVARADAAVAAGCDMVLACNDFATMDDLLARWRPPAAPHRAARLARMRRGGTPPG